MWPVSGLLCSILIISFITLCKAISLPNTTLVDESPLKMYIVEDIVKKICNISMDSFKNKTPVEKAKLIIKIDEKLKKTARPLGAHGIKYVDLIMKAVKTKAFDTYQPIELNEIQAPKLRTGTASEFDKKTNSKKEELVQNIAIKIRLLAKKFLGDTKTLEERKEAIEQIKNTFIESADRKNLTLQNKQQDIKKYVDLVSKAVELVMKEDDAKAKRRTMELVFSNNININKEYQDRIAEILNNKKSSIYESGRETKNQRKSVVFKLDNKTDLPTKTLCDSTLEEACQKIKLVKSLKCLSENTEFSIMKLCDGESDCLDSSDEKQCAIQAIESIQRATQLITYIDTSMSHNCYTDLVDKSILYKQNKILSEVLKNQLTFLEKHSIETSAAYSRKTYNVETGSIRETVHEAVSVVDSLTSALGTSMCPNSTFDGAQNRALEDINLAENLQHEDDNNKPTPEVCKCDKQNCLNTCTPRCGKICLEMYTLGQLTCEAVSGEEFVSLDVMCDGKLDCYDEIDEKDCSADVSLAKFEATNMYNYVLNEIEAKMLTVTQKLVRTRLQSLHALVTKYQKMSLKRSSDIVEVKRIRQALFEKMVKVYDSAVQTMRKESDLFEMRFYLVTLKERLISALKRSNTGNDKIISSDGCVCRGYKCALAQCSKSCIRACSAEPQLTRFFCGKLSDPLNTSLPIELLCNGKVNCPNGEDEKTCEKEICRPHHLIMLRHKLQDVGRVHIGTALGEALRSWRVKVTATLTIAESNERPTPPVLHEILRDMLHDLVMTYATLEDRRRDNSTVFSEFFTWSRVVMNTLRTCNS